MVDHNILELRGSNYIAKRFAKSNQLRISCRMVHYFSIKSEEKVDLTWRAHSIANVSPILSVNHVIGFEVIKAEMELYIIRLLRMRILVIMGY